VGRSFRAAAVSYVGRPFRAAFLAQRPLDERIGRARSNPGPDNGQDVFAKLRERTRQCVCLGSDQAERPVTPSNFFRSELTSCSALAWEES
jgi:hypothetical protein